MDFSVNREREGISHGTEFRGGAQRIEVVRRRTGGPHVFDLTPTERRHFFSDLPRTHGDERSGLLGKRQSGIRAELVGLLLGLNRAIDRATRVPAPPANIASFAAASALSLHAASASLCAAESAEAPCVPATYSVNPPRMIGTLPRGARAVDFRGGRGAAPSVARRVPPGVVFNTRSVAVDAGLIAPPWQPSPLAPEFSAAAEGAGRGLAAPVAAVFARAAAAGISAADTFAPYPPPRSGLVGGPAQEGRRAEFPFVRLARKLYHAGVGAFSLGRQGLVAALNRRLARDLADGRPPPRAFPAAALGRESWVRDVDPLPAVADWGAVLNYPPARGRVKAAQIYTAAAHDSRLLAIVHAARAHGPTSEEFIAAAKRLETDRAAQTAGARAARERLTERHIAAGMRHLLAAKRPREYQKFRAALADAWTPAAIARILGAPAFARLEKEYNLDVAYWQARVNNKCPHVKLYHEARGETLAAKFAHAYRELGRMLEPKFPAVKDRWVSCSACDFPAVCPHVLSLFRSRAEGAPENVVEARLRPFFRKDLDTVLQKYDYAGRAPHVCSICSEVIPLDTFDATAQDDKHANIPSETEDRVRVELRNAASHVHSDRGQFNTQSLIDAGLRSVAALYSRAVAVIRRDRTATAAEQDDKAHIALGLYAYAYVAAAVLTSGALRLEGERAGAGRGKSSGRTAAVLTAALQLFARRFLRGVSGASDAASVKKRFLEAFRAIGVARVAIHIADPAELLLWRLSITPAYALLRLSRWLALSPAQRRDARDPATGKAPRGAAGLPVAAVLGAPLAAFLPSGNRRAQRALFAGVALPGGPLPLESDAKVLFGAQYVWRVSTHVPAGQAAAPYPLPSSASLSRLVPPGIVSAALGVGAHGLTVQGSANVNGPPGLQFRPDVMPPLGVGFAPVSEYNFALLYWANGARQQFVDAIYSPRAGGSGSAKFPPVVVKRGDFAARASVPAGAAFDWYSASSGVSLREARAASAAESAGARKTYAERETVRDFFNFYQNRCPAGGIHEYPREARGPVPVCRKCDTPSDAQGLVKSARSIPPALRRIFVRYRAEFDRETRQTARAREAGAHRALVKAAPEAQARLAAAAAQWHYDSGPVVAWARAAGVKPRLLLLLGAYTGLLPRELAAGAGAPQGSALGGIIVNAHVYTLYMLWEIMRHTSFLPQVEPFLARIAGGVDGAARGKFSQGSGVSLRHLFVGLDKLPEISIEAEYVPRFRAARVAFLAAAERAHGANSLAAVNAAGGKLREWSLEFLARKMVALRALGGNKAGPHAKRMVPAFIDALTARFISSGKLTLAFTPAVTAADLAVLRGTTTEDVEVDNSAVEAAGEANLIPDADDEGGLAAGVDANADGGESDAEDLSADYDGHNDEDGRLYADE
jgi:hypothetical protein